MVRHAKTMKRFHSYRYRNKKRSPRYSLTRPRNKRTQRHGIRRRTKRMRRRTKRMRRRTKRMKGGMDAAAGGTDAASGGTDAAERSEAGAGLVRAPNRHRHSDPYSEDNIERANARQRWNPDFHSMRINDESNYPPNPNLKIIEWGSEAAGREWRFAKNPVAWERLVVVEGNIRTQSYPEREQSPLAYVDVSSSGGPAELSRLHLRVGGHASDGAGGGGPDKDARDNPKWIEDSPVCMHCAKPSVSLGDKFQCIVEVIEGFTKGNFYPVSALRYDSRSNQTTVSLIDDGGSDDDWQNFSEGFISTRFKWISPTVGALGYSLRPYTHCQLCGWIVCAECMSTKGTRDMNTFPPVWVGDDGITKDVRTSFERHSSLDLRVCKPCHLASTVWIPNATATYAGPPAGYSDIDGINITPNIPLYIQNKSCVCGIQYLCTPGLGMHVYIGYLARKVPKIESKVHVPLTRRLIRRRYDDALEFRQFEQKRICSKDTIGMIGIIGDVKLRGEISGLGEKHCTMFLANICQMLIQGTPGITKDTIITLDSTAGVKTYAQIGFREPDPDSSGSGFREPDPDSSGSGSDVSTGDEFTSDEEDAK